MKLTTGDAARVGNVAPDTIRYWHRRGLLAAELTSSGMRLFNQADVERVAKAMEQRRRRKRERGDNATK